MLKRQKREADGLWLAGFAVAVWLAVFAGFMLGEALAEEGAGVTTALISMEDGTTRFRRVAVLADATQGAEAHQAALVQCRAHLASTPAQGRWRACVQRADLGYLWTGKTVAWSWHNSDRPWRGAGR